MRKEIEVLPIISEDQNSDYLTKPVCANLLTKLRYKTMGW